MERKASKRVKGLIESSRITQLHFAVAEALRGYNMGLPASRPNSLFMPAEEQLPSLLQEEQV